MNVLVLGGTGNVGSLVARRLLSLGHSIRIASRDPSRIGTLPVGATAAAFHLDRAVPADFDGHDRVFCLLPRGVVLSDGQRTALFAAMSVAGVRRVVLLSGLGADRATGSALHLLEQALRESGLAHAVVRPNYMFQNLCVGALREGLVHRDEIALPAAAARISFVDGQDVAEVAVEAMLDGRDEAEAFDLTGPAAVGYADIAAAIGGVVGRPIRYRSLSDDEARAELSAAGLAPEAIEARLGFSALARRGLLAAVTPDVSRVLGRAPTGLEQFAADHVSVWSREPR